MSSSTRSTDAVTCSAKSSSEPARFAIAAAISGATEASPVSTMSPPAAMTLTARSAGAVPLTASALTSSVMTTPSNPRSSRRMSVTMVLENIAGTPGSIFEYSADPTMTSPAPASTPAWNGSR